MAGSSVLRTCAATSGKGCCLLHSISPVFKLFVSSFQFAYRIFHSTETTLLKIHNDLVRRRDCDEVASLILFDLSAPFDTVDHSIFLTRLKNWFNLDRFSLYWFSSYLSSRSQAVSINNSISGFSTISCELWFRVIPSVSFLAHCFLLSILLHLAR